MMMGIDQPGHYQVAAHKVQYFIRRSRQLFAVSNFFDHAVAHQHPSVLELLARGIHRHQCADIAHQQRAHRCAPGSRIFKHSAHIPPVAIPEDSALRSNTGSACVISGTKLTPKPTPRDVARMTALRRFIVTCERILMPDAATMPKSISVAPPNAEA